MSIFPAVPSALFIRLLLNVLLLKWRPMWGGWKESCLLLFFTATGECWDSAFVASWALTSAFYWQYKIYVFWFLVRFQMYHSDDNKLNLQGKWGKKSRSGSWHRDVLCMWGWWSEPRTVQMWGDISHTLTHSLRGRWGDKQYPTDAEEIKKGYLTNVILIVLEFVI